MEDQENGENNQSAAEVPHLECIDGAPNIAALTTLRPNLYMCGHLPHAGGGALAHLPGDEEARKDAAVAVVAELRAQLLSDRVH